MPVDPTLRRSSQMRRRSHGARAGAQLQDRLSVTNDVIRLIWQHKLWWIVPVLVASLILGVLLVLEATPVGPLLYPLF